LKSGEQKNLLIVSSALWHKLFTVFRNTRWMKSNNKSRKGKKPHHENPLPGQISAPERKQNADALRQADKDMNEDAEFTARSKNDDLDEGETARLGEGKNDLV